jgi:hypothetical protein
MGEIDGGPPVNRGSVKGMGFRLVAGPNDCGTVVVHPCNDLPEGTVVEPVPLSS